MHLALLAGWIVFQLPCIVSGRVVDGVTGEPVIRARVALGELRQTVETGENGAFEFREVAGEALTVRVTAVGYATTRKTVLAGNMGQPLEIVLVPEGAALSERVTVTT